jgi:DNA repair protein RadC
MTQAASQARWNRHSVSRTNRPIPEEDIVLLGRLLAKSNLASGIARAADLLQRVGGINAALAASIPKLRSLGLDEAEIRSLDLVRQTMVRALRRETEERSVMGNLDAVVDYLYVDMAYRSVEVFRILFLSVRNHLLHDEIMHIGSLDQVEVQPRSILQRALEVNAAALIAVHNHPSGEDKPSVEDIKMTRHLISAAEMFKIILHDHIIISRFGYSSMRQLKIIR